MKIEEKNILIMEFMGVEPRQLGNQWSWADSPFFSVLKYEREDVIKSMAEYVKYSTSWDWIHPVVDAIGHVSFYDNPGLEQYLAASERNDKTPNIFSSIDVWYDWAVDVIQWLNKQPKL